MTGSTLGKIIIEIVTVIVLAAGIALVFHADAHPAWRRQVPPVAARRRHARARRARLHSRSTVTASGLHTPQVQ